MASPFDRLRSLAERWKYEATQATCCQFAADEDLEENPEVFNCEACPVADILSALEDDSVNHQAWRIYQRLASRFAADTHAGSVILQRLTSEMDTDDFRECLDRLMLLYDTLAPPPETQT